MKLSFPEKCSMLDLVSPKEDVLRVLCKVLCRSILGVFLDLLWQLGNERKDLSMYLLCSWVKVLSCWRLIVFYFSAFWEIYEQCLHSVNVLLWLYLQRLCGSYFFHFFPGWSLFCGVAFTLLSGEAVLFWSSDFAVRCVIYMEPAPWVTSCVILDNFYTS